MRYTATKTAQPVITRDIDHYASLSTQTGFLADWKHHEGLLNLEPGHAGELFQSEMENIIEKLHKIREDIYRKTLDVFHQRFKKDKNIFAEYKEQDIFQIFEVMTRQMLVFFPNRVSADITGDASLVLQAYYGDFHFYWETFLDNEEQTVFSTLNIYSNKLLKFTESDSFIAIQQRFIETITPLYKQYLRLEFD